MSVKAVQNMISDISESVHLNCFVCGSQNISGLHLKYSANEDGSVEAEFQCDECYEGYLGILHGGVIASVLDGAMGNCMFAHGRATMTVEMLTRFRHPILTGRVTVVTARIKQNAHPLYLLEAEIIQEGRVKATAKGKYYDQPKLINATEQIE
jgi:uncharacterized protein (TIGR00369 family)